jgi:hypothetical protein
MTCDPPLAKLWEFHSIYSLSHVYDLLETLEVKEFIVSAAREEDRKNRENNEPVRTGRK